MSQRPPSWACIGTVLVCLAVSACGKDRDEAPPAPVAKTALPAYPAWAQALVGKNAARVLNGRGECKGVFDTVSARHEGSPSGVEAEGWGWDVAAKQPVQHVLFVNSDDFVIGAAEGGRSRADVSKALVNVTSDKTGWHGEIGALSGKVLAVGVTTRNQACDVGSLDIGPTG